MDYTSLAKTDLFEFFHITETNRETTTNGNIEIHLKPGGFKESIDLNFLIDPDNLMLSATLFLDRSWVGTIEHVNLFAVDIAKTFISQMVPSPNNTEVQPLVRYFFFVKGTKDVVLRLKKATKHLGSLPEEYLNALHCFIGTEERWKKDMSDCELIIENVLCEGKSRVQILVTYKKKC